MSEWVLVPLDYAFFTRALLAGVLVGAMSGALSTFVVLRRMSYIGHGLAHSVLGGVAVGMALGLDLYVGAMVATVLSALLIDAVARQRGLHADAAIGIVTTTIFAIGVAVIAIVPTRLNVEAVLFGNLLGVDRTDLAVAAGVGVTFLLVLVLLYKPLVFTTFDQEVARVHGVRTRAMELVFSLVTAAVVVASVRVLGVLLIAAAVVIPGATARLVTRSVGTMLALSTLLGVGAAVAGLYLSFHLDVPSGPSIVLTGALVFAVVVLVTAVTTRLGLSAVRRHEAQEPATEAPTPSTGGVQAADRQGARDPVAGEPAATDRLARDEGAHRSGSVPPRR